MRSGRGVVASWNRRRPALLLAARDAARHRGRTLLSTLLVVIPVVVVILGALTTVSAPPSRRAALATVPDGAQAVVTATAVTRTGEPFQQLPEGSPGPWVDDTEQVPAGKGELAAALPSGDRLLQYWNSPELLVTTDLGLAPGEESATAAGTAAVPTAGTAQSGASGIARTSLQEAGDGALALLLPPLTQGSAPASSAEVAISSALAERLGVGVGEVLTMVAPPFNGWFSSDGRVGEVVQDSRRAYRVSGVVDDGELQAWAPEGWISRQVEADPAGIDGHWLVVGSEPVTWDQARVTNSLQAFVVSRHVLGDGYPETDQLYPVPIDPGAAMLRVVTVLMVGVLGVGLMLFLVTPAFAVSADQSRRTLGLVAATGGTPADLRRIISAQGLVIGLVGGVVGGVLGVLGVVFHALVRSPGKDVIGAFPWWIVPAAVLLAIALGLCATAVPARTASRLRPVDALKDRPTRTGGEPFRGGRSGGDEGSAQVGGVHRASLSGSRGSFTGMLGVGALIAAVLLAVLSLTLPVSTTGGMSGGAARGSGATLPDPPGTVSSSALVSLTLMVAAFCLALLGCVLVVRLLTGLGARVAHRLPVAPRLALRDASDHRSRFVPAATAVLVAVAAASYAATMVGSLTANNRDAVGEMVDATHLVLGAQVPVDAEFDRQVLMDGVSALDGKFHVVGTEPIRAVSSSQGALNLAAVLPDGVSCPADEYPDTASSVEVGAPLRCAGWMQAYQPGLSVPWWGGSDTYVMTGDALRASGLRGAEEAARVLDEGGVVVNNAAKLGADGRVRVALARSVIPDLDNAERTVELPGAFLRGFAPITTVSPTTARSLGVVDMEYVGEYVVTDPGLSASQVSRAKDLIEARTSLVWVGTTQFPHAWGTNPALLPTALLGLVALVSTAVSLMLARTQGRRDVVTMEAVGATPGFIRRFTVTQAAVVMVMGLPLGTLVGIGLGSYQVAWNRRVGLDGAWLDTVPLWGVQASLAIGVLLVALGVAALIGRPARDLVRRSID